MPPDCPHAAPAFRIRGRARSEPHWHVVTVLATRARDADSRWPRPFWRGTCITWTASLIAVGWDFAAGVLREQAAEPASPDRPVEVAGGRLRGGRFPTCSEILAHECGHTGQARRMGLLYWPVGAALTLFREGDGWPHWFENEASAAGQFGGIVSGSVHPCLHHLLAGGGRMTGDHLTE